MTNPEFFRKAFDQGIGKMRASITMEMSKRSVSAYDFFVQEVYYCLSISSFGGFSFRPLGKIIHCYQDVSVAFCRHWQGSYEVDSNSFEWCFCDNRMHLVVGKGFLSSLTLITRLDIKFYIFLHIRPEVFFFQLCHSQVDS